MILQHEAAERAIAGSLLVRGDWALAQIADVVRPEDFYSLGLRAVYQVALELWRRREPVDLVTVEAQLTARDDLRLVGGLAGLAKLSDLGTLTGIEAHARRVSELARARRLVLLCRDVAQDTESALGRPLEWLEAKEALLLEALRREAGRSCINAAALMDLVVAEVKAGLRGEPLRALSTGFVDVDARLAGGLRPGELVIVAGRASMGKTALVLNILARSCVMRVREWVQPRNERPRKEPGLMFSLEMSHLPLGQRLIAFEAGVPFERLLQRTLSHDEADRVLTTALRVDSADLLIDAAPGITLLEMRARARRWRFDQRRFPVPVDGKSPIGLICVDYLQLVQTLEKGQNREQQVADLSRGLKQLAGELECVVVVLSQLNRAADGREDHEPVLSDLRESGAIEQDADVVMFPFRPAYYKKDAALEEQRKAKLIIAKTRNGRVGSVPLTWFGETQTFGDSAWRP